MKLGQFPLQRNCTTSGRAVTPAPTDQSWQSDPLKAHSPAKLHILQPRNHHPERPPAVNDQTIQRYIPWWCHTFCSQRHHHPESTSHCVDHPKVYPRQPVYLWPRTPSSRAPEDWPVLFLLTMQCRQLAEWQTMPYLPGDTYNPPSRQRKRCPKYHTCAYTTKTQWRNEGTPHRPRQHPELTWTLQSAQHY